VQFERAIVVGQLCRTLSRILVGCGKHVFLLVEIHYEREKSIANNLNVELKIVVPNAKCVVVNNLHHVIFFEKY